MNDIKLEFVDVTFPEGDDTDRKTKVNYFKLCESYEEKFGKDVCEFTEEETVEFFESLTNYLYSTLKFMRYFYNKYLLYCREYYPDKFNVTLSDLNCCLTNEKLESIAKKIVATTYDDYQNALMNTNDPVTLLIVEAIWNGLDKKEIALMKLEDIKDRVLSCYTFEANGDIIKTREVKIDNRLIFFCRKCSCGENGYVLKFQEKRLMNQKRSLMNRVQYITNVLTKLSKESGHDLSYNTIRHLSIVHSIMEYRGLYDISEIKIEHVRGSCREHLINKYNFSKDTKPYRFLEIVDRYR